MCSRRSCSGLMQQPRRPSLLNNTNAILPMQGYYTTNTDALKTWLHSSSKPGWGQALLTTCDVPIPSVRMHMTSLNCIQHVKQSQVGSMLFSDTQHKLRANASLSNSSITSRKMVVHEGTHILLMWLVGFVSTPDETLVGAGQVAPHGITLNVGDAIISRRSSDVCSIATVCLYACAGDHKALIRQDPWESSIVAAIAGACTSLLQGTCKQ